MSRKQVVLLILGMSFPVFAWFFIDRQDDGFQVEYIRLEKKKAHISLPFPLKSSQQDHLSLLNQKFTYLGKGAQSYVFASEDGKYVLKFFKFKHLKTNQFLKTLAEVSGLTSFSEKMAKKEKKIHGVFKSHAIAYQKLEEESGLIYFQLQPDFAPHFTTIVLKSGKELFLNLQEEMFILQKRGIVAEDLFMPLLKQEKWGEVEMWLTRLLTLYRKEYEKGIFDRDHSAMRNMGFLGNEALHLDIGKISLMSTSLTLLQREEDLAKVSFRMEEWVTRFFPQHLSKWRDAWESSILASRVLMP